MEVGPARAEGRASGVGGATAVDREEALSGAVAAPYIATIDRVREITLVGASDLAFWRRRLAEERLVPGDVGGHAESVVTVTLGRWAGLAFREVILAVRVSRDPGGDGSDRSAIYLAHAFSSSRFLAFMERTLFRTPYLPAEVACDVPSLRGFRVVEGPRAVLAGELPAGARRVAADPELWEGPICLTGGTERFFARLSGVTETFEAPGGCLRIDASGYGPAHPMRAFADAGFEPLRWSTRSDAIHARSRTVAR